MKAIFKDSNKLIVTSMTASEAIIAEQFIKDLEEKELTIKIEKRFSNYDDLDGLVISLVDVEKETDTELD